MHNTGIYCSERRNYVNSTIIVFGTQTQANKAKRLLSSHGLRLSITKITDDRGCAYGLYIDDSVLLTGVRILKENQIEYTVYRE